MESTRLTDIQTEKDYRTARFFSPLFHQEIEVTTMDLDTPLDYIERCVKAFNELTADQLGLLYRYSEAYCMDFCEFVGEEPPAIHKPADVLTFIRPMRMEIPAVAPADAEQTAAIIHMELECDWEVEHGLEWLVREDQILYVGSCNMLKEWEEEQYYAEYNLNYVYGNTFADL